MDEVNFNVGRKRLAATYALLGVALALVVAFGVVSAGATRSRHHRPYGYGGCDSCTTTTKHHGSTSTTHYGTTSSSTSTTCTSTSTTTTTAPTTSTTGHETTTTAPNTTTTAPETTTTAPETTTTVPETSTSLGPPVTTAFTTTTRPGTTTTLHEQGTPTTTAPTTTAPTTPTTTNGNLPHTGSGTAGPFMFGVSCIAGGTLLAMRRRRSVVRINPR